MKTVRQIIGEQVALSISLGETKELKKQKGRIFEVYRVQTGQDKGVTNEEADTIKKIFVRTEDELDVDDVMPGSIDDAIRRLQELKEEGWETIGIDECQYVCFYVGKMREETDCEAEIRIGEHICQIISSILQNIAVTESKKLQKEKIKKQIADLQNQLNQLNKEGN